MLGLRFWERYSVTFDFPNHLIYLKPSKTFALPDPIGLSGINTLRIGGRVVIDRIDEGSPAAKARIRVKDVVLRIDGQDLATMRLHAFRLRLCEGGKTVRLSIRRGDRTLDVPVVLPARGAIKAVQGAANRGPIVTDARAKHSE